MTLSVFTIILIVFLHLLGLLLVVFRNFLLIANRDTVEYALANVSISKIIRLLVSVFIQFISIAIVFSIPLISCLLIYFNPISLIGEIFRLFFWIVYLAFSIPLLLFFFKKGHSENEQWGMAGALPIYILATLIAVGLELISYFIHEPTAMVFQGFFAIWITTLWVVSRFQRK